jgi:hypothetical protein
MGSNLVAVANVLTGGRGAGIDRVLKFSAGPAMPSEPSPAFAAPAHAPASASPPTAARQQPAASTDEIFAMIERLAEMYKKGVLTDQEFEAKKTELLGRL